MIGAALMPNTLAGNSVTVMSMQSVSIPVISTLTSSAFAYSPSPMQLMMLPSTELIWTSALIWKTLSWPLGPR
jgi:hypothetical protein